MAKSYPALHSAFYNRPLCLLPAKAGEIDALLSRQSQGGSLSSDEVALITDARRDIAAELVSMDGVSARLDDSSPSGGSARYAVVLPLFGVMFQHGGMQMEASGGTSASALADRITQYDNTPSVATIVLRVHSPGGQVWGTSELAETIRGVRQRGQTRIVAAVDSQAASAALWTSVAASEVYITPGGEIGSLGVLQIHQDISGAEQRAGVKTTLIAHPERKVEGHPFSPLPGSVRDRLLGEVQEVYQTFLASVARSRGVSTEYAEAKFGGGGMLTAKQAVDAGLADGVASYREVIRRETERLRYGSKNSGRHRQANRNTLALAGDGNPGGRSRQANANLLALLEADG